MLMRAAASFDQWRTEARKLLSAGIPPAEVIWQDSDAQACLFEAEERQPEPSAFKIPRKFLALAETVARHRDPGKWALLYRVAWRVVNENRNLLQVEVDDDVRALELMRKAIDRDIYRMRQFVRFRKIETAGQEQFIAWYRPDHYTLDANARFFSERFGSMSWAILTPDQSMFWSDGQLQFGPGVPRSEAPAEDQMEELWRAYYASIFNPARVNLNAMRAQLPVRAWENLPESRLIAPLSRNAASRVVAMAGRPLANVDVPPHANLTELRDVMMRSYPRGGTQPVFGEGPENASMILVGEQPGDEEDRAGRPFVGPAGKVLDMALAEAGLDRPQLYLTNAVKTFLYIERGKRRIHQTPKGQDIAAGRPWLTAEISLIRPKVIVCLGATAGQAVFGRSVRIGQERGSLQPHHLAAGVLVTYHPSAVLRAPDEAQSARTLELLVSDLKLAGSALRRTA